MRMSRALTVVLGAIICISTAAAEDGDQVVQAIKESVQDNSRLNACILLAQANTSKDRAAQKKAIETVTGKLKHEDVNMLRARADVARKGLFGYPQDTNLAYRMYAKAAKSAEAGWNAALMLYQRDPSGASQTDAKAILDVLQKSGASAMNSRGIIGGYSHYIAGRLLESGIAGKADEKQAFIHYRASARNAYVPGAYHYMRLLMRSVPKLPEGERGVVLQEMRMMINRWKWQSPEIMLLAGDAYSARWYPDTHGFMAQYHWRMAAKMGASEEIGDMAGALNTRIKKLPAEMEKRLDESVEAGMRNTMQVKHTLEYSDLCVE